MSLGQSMIDAAQGAMLGRAIGEANARADEAERNAREWYQRAQELLQEVNARGRHANELHAKLMALRAREEEAERNLVLAKRAMQDPLVMNATIRRGEQYKKRLAQVELALRHESGATVALTTMVNIYGEIIERLNLSAEVPADLGERIQSAVEKFFEDGTLTTTAETQAVLDAERLPSKPFGSRLD